MGCTVPDVVCACFSSFRVISMSSLQVRMWSLQSCTAQTCLDLFVVLSDTMGLPEREDTAELQ